MQPASSYLIFLLIPVIFGLGLAGFGAIFVVTAMRAKKAPQATQAWTTAIGRVISTSIHPHTTYSPDGTHVSYKLVVEYEYLGLIFIVIGMGTGCVGAGIGLLLLTARL